VDELFSKKNTPGLRDCNGRGAQVLNKQASKVTLAYAEALC
jgi:hypothetical protein